MKRLIALAVTSVAALSALGQVVPTGYSVQTWATGITQITTFEFIGPGRVLALEKGTGIVRHILNGVNQGVALDLPVNASSERGLLGICIDPNFAINGYVYLYYSRAATDGGTWLDNRVEKYIWNGSTLTFFQLIISFPFDGAQSNGPNHDGGILAIGPDEKLYIVTGDLNRSRLEQNRSSVAISGVGGVHRLNLDGSVPGDNPFTFHPDPIVKTYFTYGCRNSFGLTFDPFTGKLWYTENGPNVYDEINVASSGFNSGWSVLMGPDDRDPDSADDLIYLTNAYYADPIFSWLTPIGVTAIQFLDSIQWLPAHKDNMMVANSNQGELYVFEMTPNRDDIVLLPGLEDRVADSSAERTLNRFATGFGIVTDIKVGPDKLLYVASLNHNRIYRIRPQDYVIAPETLSIIRGFLMGGTFMSLEDSDNDRLVLRRGVIPTFSNEPSVRFETLGTASVSSTARLELVVESSVSDAGIQQTVELFNYQTSQFEIVSQTFPGLSDTVANAVITSNPSRFIDPATRTVRTRTSYSSGATIIPRKWIVSVDNLVVKVRE